eukprot:NODE_3049_length_428_cov_0.685246_g3025_i0.p1 GENE.NODE_3049_length_428_cov_0.685246_g3025_i0~~NODE_3049_length_428_cov_0.685246_g3025_i0.p1  ORF type:complete len:114 (+),score=3.04 NODE_3049_length_428_cov_0.685246_g3025_i0:50-391(+)
MLRNALKSPILTTFFSIPIPPVSILKRDSTATVYKKCSFRPFSFETEVFQFWSDIEQFDPTHSCSGMYRFVNTTSRHPAYCLPDTYNKIRDGLGLQGAGTKILFLLNSGGIAA